MKKSRNTLRTKIIGVATVGILTSLIAVSPAQASVTCSSLSSTGTLAIAICKGTGKTRLAVRCNAIWPFPVWTKYGPWVNTGTQTMTLTHPACAATLSVWVENKD